MMPKRLNLRFEGNQIYIEGYPDAVSVKRLDGPMADQLGAMTLHRSDLLFCQEALAEIARLDQSQQPLLVEALWIASIARYFKCFGRSQARTPFNLSAAEILSAQPGADSIFTYFQALRDKHIIHDDNTYSAVSVGIVLSSRGADHKVGDVVASPVTAVTAEAGHLSPFRQLVEATLAWVTAKWDDLHHQLTETYEQKPYEELQALPGMQYRAPTGSEVDKTR